MTISYTNLLNLFDQLEPLQKKVECLGTGLDGPALNETRNATYHLLRALQKQDGDGQDEVGKAERHAQRAIYDCHEAILLYELEKLRTFKEDYKTVVVTDAFPEYIQGKLDADYALAELNNVRAGNILDANNYENGFYSQERSNIYAKIEPYVLRLHEFNNKCESAREELNKIIHKENKDKVWAFLGKIAVIATIIGVPIAVWH